MALQLEEDLMECPRTAEQVRRRLAKAGVKVSTRAINKLRQDTEFWRGRNYLMSRMAIERMGLADYTQELIELTTKNPELWLSLYSAD